MAIQYKPLPVELFDVALRPYIAQLNATIRELAALEGTLRNPMAKSRSDATILRRESEQVHVTRIIPDVSTVVSGASTVVGTPALTFGLTNTVGSTSTALSVNSAIALFSTDTPPAVDAGSGVAGLSSTAANLGHRHQVSTDVAGIVLGTSATIGAAATLLRSNATIAAFGTQGPQALSGTSAVGTSAYAAREDHVHLFPTSLRSTANASTLTLTDNGSAQTLSGSLGDLTIESAGTVVVEARTGGAANAMTINADPDDGNRKCITAGWFSGSVSSSTLTCWDATISAMSGVFTTAKFTGFQNGAFSFTPQAGSDAANIAYSADLVGPVINNSTGGWSEIAGLNISGPRRILSNPTVTLAAGIITECPTISGTSQIGLYIKQRTAQHTATNRYGIFVDAHNSGTNRYVFYGVSDTLYHGGKIQHAGVQVGLYGATPTVQFGTTGTEAGFAAGTSTAVTVDSTFTGNTGTRAYTTGDVVRALKLIGALAY